MPEKLIHCQNCRALLNPDLELEPAPVPEFAPLPELESMIDAPAKGYYVTCPACERELRIGKQYRDMRLACKFCAATFRFNPSEADSRYVAFQVVCPHCDRELRASWKYLNLKVICKHCSARLRLVDPAEPESASQVSQPEEKPTS